MVTTKVWLQGWWACPVVGLSCACLAQAQAQAPRGALPWLHVHPRWLAGCTARWMVTGSPGVLHMLMAGRQDTRVTLQAPPQLW